MVGLIVMSVMVAAFAPVITKKVQNSSVALAQQDAINQKVIQSRLYNYADALHGIDGCIVVNNGANGAYLQCPFEVPEEVDKINFIIVSAGGGGGGGKPNSVNPKTASATSGNTTTINITKFTQNVKIPYLVGAGGGGGGGYFYYKWDHTDAIDYPPASQTDCDNIAGSGKSYYISSTNSCITSSNLSASSASNTGITTLSTNTAYSTNSTNKLCWSGNTGYTGTTDTFTNAKMFYHLSGTGSSTYPVCSYYAASAICSNYGSGSYVGKWHLPSSTEGTWLRENHAITIHAFYQGTKGKGNDTYGYAYHPTGNTCNPGVYNSIDVGEVYTRDTKCTSSTDSNGTTNTLNTGVFYNLCLPEYMWLQNMGYTSITSSISYYIHGRGTGCLPCFNYATAASFTVPSNPALLSKTDCSRYAFITYGTDGGPKQTLSFVNQQYAPFSVRCSINWKRTTPASDNYTYHHASGGGGASGGLLQNIVIPQSVISANVGGTIELKSGAGGSAGSGSASSNAASNPGGAGGITYVRVKNGSTVKWCIGLAGGNGGGKGTGSATSQTAGAAGSAVSVYQYNPSGDCSTSYNKSTIASGVGTGSFTAGAGGAAGGAVATSATSSGGGGGVSRYSSQGAGGAGGAAYGTSAASGTAGSTGYVYLTYDETYAGAPGGGGGGGHLLRVEDISVTEGQRFIVKIGRGGLAGSASFNSYAGGKGGESSFGSYVVYGGQGGGAGAMQQSNGTGPTGGAAGNVTTGGSTTGKLYKAGSAGTAGSVASTLQGTGGRGGNSGVNNYLNSKSVQYSDLSVGCGGYMNDTTYKCANSGSQNAIFTGDLFANPGKVHRPDSLKYGSAGNGGGGGGVNPSANVNGSAMNGQNGYVYIWWEEYQ